MPIAVYVVFHGDYSGRGTVGVFSTREKADEFLAERKKDDPWYGDDVEEWEVDGLVGAVERRLWWALVMYSTGAITIGPRDGYTELAGPHLRSRVEKNEKYFRAYSFESVEHACKLAAEEYQRHLREKATHPN